MSPEFPRIFSPRVHRPSSSSVNNNQNRLSTLRPNQINSTPLSNADDEPEIDFRIVCDDRPFTSSESVWKQSSGNSTRSAKRASKLTSVTENNDCSNTITAVTKIQEAGRGKKTLKGKKDVREVCVPEKDSVADNLTVPEKDSAADNLTVPEKDTADLTVPKPSNSASASVVRGQTKPSKKIKLSDLKNNGQNKPSKKRKLSNRKSKVFSSSDIPKELSTNQIAERSKIYDINEKSDDEDILPIRRKTVKRTILSDESDYDLSSKTKKASQSNNESSMQDKENGRDRDVQSAAISEISLTLVSQLPPSISRIQRTTSAFSGEFVIVMS